jgi:hypothetical protein
MIQGTLSTWTIISRCFIINNILLVMICYSFLGVSGFLRNEFNLHFLSNFLFRVVRFNER